MHQLEFFAKIDPPASDVQCKDAAQNIDVDRIVREQQKTRSFGAEEREAS